MAITIEFEPTTIPKTGFYKLKIEDLADLAISTITDAAGSIFAFSYDNVAPISPTVRSLEFYIDTSTDTDADSSGTVNFNKVESMAKVADLVSLEKTEGEINTDDYDLIVTSRSPYGDQLSTFDITIKNVSGLTKDIYIVYVTEGS